jgi:predicted DNA-binding protein (MmcQ/YjbR family)
MTTDKLINYCLSKNNAYLDYPFGEEPICVKVKNKIFAQIYPKDENYKITLKCEPMLADFYRQEYPGVVLRGYHCPPKLHAFWNTVYINQSVSDNELLNMIDHSYLQVLKTFPQKVQKEIGSFTNITGYSESEFYKTNAIIIKRIEIGFEQYQYAILEGDEDQYLKFFSEIMLLNGSDHSYADFYYSKLTMEQKEKLKNALTPDELGICNNLELSEDIFYSLTEQFMRFLLHISAKELLFSSFYFTKYPCTIWGNYGLRFPIFFNSDTIKKRYQKLAIKCGLTFDD